MILTFTSARIVYQGELTKSIQKGISSHENPFLKNQSTHVQPDAVRVKKGVILIMDNPFFVFWLRGG